MPRSRPLPPLYRLFARSRAETIGAIAALAVCLPALFGQRWYSDTGLYTAISTKAAREGYWWTLYLSDSPYFNKPPLAFWIHGALIKLFGLFTDRPPTAFVIHLPEVLAVIGTVILAAWITRKLAGPRAALFTAIFLPGIHQFVFLVDSFRLDHLHTLFLFAALALIVRALTSPGCHGHGQLWDRDHAAATPHREELPQRPSPLLPLLLSGLPIGLALLVKPLWSLLFFITIAIWLLTLPRIRHASSRRLIPWLALALLLALAIAAPWYVSMYLLHGKAFITQHFIEQALERGTGEKFKSGPWYWYLHYLVIEAPVWVALAVAALLFRPFTRRRLARNPAAPLLAIVWIAFWLALFSCFRGKSRYWLTHFYPMFAMLAGLLLARITFFPKLAPLGRWLTRATLPAAIALLLASAILSPRFALVPHDARQPAGKPEAYWDDVEKFLTAEQSPAGAHRDIYNGSLHYNDAARLYVTTSTWPKSRNWSGLPYTDIPTGALLIYDNTHRAPPPGTGAEVVLRSGRLVIVQTPSAAPR